MRPSRSVTRVGRALLQNPYTAITTQAPPVARPQTTSTIPLRRTLSSTAQTCYRQKRLPADQPPIPSATADQPHIPAYPYGERRVYKQSNTGLYGSASIRFGNNISERHEIKTRRKWRPNVQSKMLWSESLGVMVRTRITTRVLRTVDKVGGLDNYLLGTTARRIKDLGPWGWKLRWRIMQTPTVKAMFAKQRQELGLPPAADEPGIVSTTVEQELPEGLSAEELMEQTQGMLDRGEEFSISGEEADAGFMREEKRPSRGEALNL